jgi:ubiquinone/menaquinone biosynthesis C-methylase UbiE
MAGNRIPTYCDIFWRERFEMTMAYFNNQAEHWDEKAAEKDAFKLERMAKRLMIKKSDTVLDVGTGTGVFLPYLLEKTGTYGEVIALDIAEKMLLKAKSKGFKGNIDYLCADVMAIPIANEAIDAVVCYSSMPHFPDKEAAMMEINRVLKKGGWIFVCHTSSREHINQIHRQIPSVQNDFLPDAIEIFGLFSEAGFMGIQVEDKTDGYFACACKPG